MPLAEEPELRLDPNERAVFIERTGVVIRWVLIGSCSIVQFISPLVPFLVFYIALPISMLYNGLIPVLIRRKRERIVLLSQVTAVADILISLTLIYFAGTKDIYLWYFVLLVSHAARFGFTGAILSPILFAIVYSLGLYLRGLQFPPEVMALRSLFFVITGLVSGYLAREEHRRFDRILGQQKEIYEAKLKRKELRDTLQKYVSYNIVEELLANPQEMRLGGSRKKVSVLFSDIQGFTGMLATTEPEEVILYLNEYFTEMTGIIFEHDGMVDKFVGDAIIGIFGAIRESPDDSLRAVRCALKMQSRLRELREKWEKESPFFFQSRIAVNSGCVIMGNIGSPQRMDFTAIGDPVNTASRLQAVAAVGTVVIGSDVYQEVGRHFEVRKLEEAVLKGKKEPVEIYQVLKERPGE